MRDAAQQLVRTVYEAGYLEKLDELYSDTGPDGFLDSTATPGPTPWHQYRADMTSAERDRYVDDPVTIPSSMILPPGASTANLDGLSLAELALGATDNEARRVYANSVDDARKTLADDRAQASLDDSLAEFDQDVLDREVDDTPVEVPDLLTYQARDDEPVAPTYELYEPGTIWGDRDWHEQGFNPAADPPEDEPVVEPPTSSEDFLLDTLAQARDEYGDFDFSVNIDYYDVSSSGDPDTTYRDGPYLQHVPTAILGKVRDQKSWDQGNLPGTSTYSSETGSNPWYTASPAVDFPGVFTGNGASAGATLPVYTPPGSPPPSSFGSTPPSGDSSPPAGSFQQPRTSDAGSNESTAAQNTAAETQEITDQTTPNDGAGALNEGVDNPLSPMLDEIRRSESEFLFPNNVRPFDARLAYAAPIANANLDVEQEVIVIELQINCDCDPVRTVTPRIIKVGGRSIVVTNDEKNQPSSPEFRRATNLRGMLVVEGLSDPEADFYIDMLARIVTLDSRIADAKNNPPLKTEFSGNFYTVPYEVVDHHALSQTVEPLAAERAQLVEMLTEAGFGNVSVTGIAKGRSADMKQEKYSGRGIEDGVKALVESLWDVSGTGGLVDGATLADAYFVGSLAKFTVVGVTRLTLATGKLATNSIARLAPQGGVRSIALGPWNNERTFWIALVERKGLNHLSTRGAAGSNALRDSLALGDDVFRGLSNVPLTQMPNVVVLRTTKFLNGTPSLRRIYFDATDIAATAKGFRIPTNGFFARRELEVLIAKPELWQMTKVYVNGRPIWMTSLRFLLKNNQLKYLLEQLAK